MNVIAAKKKGFRVLAGPFDSEIPEESRLSHRIRDFIESTGGRVISADSAFPAGSFYLYRPGLEMETMKQTERRLDSAKLRNQSTQKPTS